MNILPKVSRVEEQNRHFLPLIYHIFKAIMNYFQQFMRKLHQLSFFEAFRSQPNVVEHGNKN